MGLRAKFRILTRILIQKDGVQTKGSGSGWCEIIHVSPRVIRAYRLSTAVWVDEEPGVVGVGSQRDPGCIKEDNDGDGCRLASVCDGSRRLLDSKDWAPGGQTTSLVRGSNTRWRRAGKYSMWGIFH